MTVPSVASSIVLAKIVAPPADGAFFSFCHRPDMVHPWLEGGAVEKFVPPCR
jgi:hypothetical protein